ncbi:restriction endonuclease [Anaerotruncus rubiinfantis]|uniref:restriction endonuclease n=1 Tax=Anaerotruncus rubiinfantis TaxID=1720200 RepID=UPI003D7BDDCF
MSRVKPSRGFLHNAFEAFTTCASCLVWPMIFGAWYVPVWLSDITVQNYGGSHDFYVVLYSSVLLIAFFLIVYHLTVLARLEDDFSEKVHQAENDRTKALIAQKLDLEKTAKKLFEESEKAKALIGSADKIISETSQMYPWMATLFADYLYMNDKNIAAYLRTKSRPALVASEQVSIIAKEKRELQKQCKMLEYQLNYYETIFPWLEEFKTCDPKVAASYLNEVSSEKKEEYETLKNWLSPEEYKNLSNTEKYQLALDRYCNRKKSDWEVGIEYERYIGYVYEQTGGRVNYQGALKGLEDMGIDLIVEFEDSVFVVQCKRWAKEKSLHEKHIFQLYGTSVVYRIEHPDKPVVPVFVTTATISELAKQCADFLLVKVIENYPIKEYPMIKCNVSKSGEKIYHLPFDQQYDRAIINPNDGDCYAYTVQEAEQLGFRRAYRWKGNKQE